MQEVRDKFAIKRQNNARQLSELYCINMGLGFQKIQRSHPTFISKPTSYLCLTSWSVLKLNCYAHLILQKHFHHMTTHGPSTDQEHQDNKTSLSSEMKTTFTSLTSLNRSSISNPFNILAYCLSIGTSPPPK